jgi:hypothetical protein
MSLLLHLEFSVPRSWDQFEELCADLFEVMWSDPSLLRHGRAGQAQHGVDIVASRGVVYPVGLQCKKKTRWPAKRLTFAEVKVETEKADQFSPALKEFYILTTAPGDGRLEQQVRDFNETRMKAKLFPVTVLPWPEIVRRVALYDRVARKHFPLGKPDGVFSPLLATWYTRNGKLEVTGEEWELAVSEVGEDFQDWPSGHVAVRQRETDELISKVRGMDGAAKKERKRKLEIRRELRYLRNRATAAEQIVRMLYTNPLLKTYMLDVYDGQANVILKSIIESEVSLELRGAGDCKIRLAPPSPERLQGPFSAHSVAQSDLAVRMSPEVFAEILTTEREFSAKYHGNRMAQVVLELPEDIQNRLAIPAILRRLHRIMQEDRKTVQELELAGYLNFSLWKYTH